MNKKVLVISSTPRNSGNSDVLCDEFIKGAQEAGHQTEKIRLKDKNINYCTGCGCCNDQNTPCPQKDDMPELIQKMIEADVIVMATPVYFYTVSAQMKTFIDRCCAKYTHITNKEFYFIITAADTREIALQRTLEDFRGFLDCLNYADEKGVLFGTGVWQLNEVKQTRYMQEAYQLGKNV